MKLSKIRSFLFSDPYSPLFRESVVKSKKRRAEDIAALFVCAVISVIFLGICTRSSPLYPLNDWVDSNCYFTVGKAMMNGRVVYRDIYEQKGIFLYFIHGLGYLISNTTFIGVYFFEVAAHTAFLYFVYKSARLYVNYLLSLIILPILSHSILTAVSLRQGDSAEEFCLPFVMYAIYALLKSLRSGERSGIPDNRTVFFMGICAAAVMWIKFTLLGVFIGYIIYALILCIIDRDMKKLLRAAISFASGAILASIPVVMYFGFNGALSDLFEVYFHNNMFLYTDERTFTDKLAGVFSLSVKGLSYNGLWGKLAYLGFFAMVIDIREPRAPLGTLLMFLSHIFFIYYGGIGWYYYSLGMAALSVPGFIAAARILVFAIDKLSDLYITLEAAVCGKPKKKKPELTAQTETAEETAKEMAKSEETAKPKSSVFDSSVMAAVSYVLIAAVITSVTVLYTDKCYRDSDNVFYMSYTEDEVWQKRFAKIINESEDKTLLNYSCLDLGVYTAANIVPSEKYFARLNIDLPEMKESLDSAISEQRTEFVVIRSTPSKFVLQYYDIIAAAKSHLEFEGSSASYYLLKRKPV